MLRGGTRWTRTPTPLVTLLRRGVASGQLCAREQLLSSSSQRRRLNWECSSNGTEKGKIGPTRPQSWHTANASAQSAWRASGAGCSGGAAIPAVQVFEKCLVVMPVEEGALPSFPSLFQEGGVMNWKGYAHQQQKSEDTRGLNVMTESYLEELIGKIDLDGDVEWEELQASSVMKKRKKAMNKHKWKKRKKRDRNYDR